MRLKSLEINGFKSFAKKTFLEFSNPVVAVVGPNGSGKSNVVEAIRFVLGEQSMKSMRGKLGMDLIFKGSKNLSKGSRAVVAISFDNSDKIFKLSNESGENINLNYDNISISREVYSDGLNKYILNGSEVRLKDINALLASVNIGSSGHHIISQGEADRILNASPKDRREMVEDALGLKIYQYKIKEAERKLERTNNNMKEISLLRRENAPHLNFLKKQVEKLEKAKEMKTNLLSFYREYFKKESVYLDQEKNKLSDEKNKIIAEIKDISKKISEKGGDDVVRNNPKVDELKNLESRISHIRSTKGEIERKLGRIEGMIEMEERRTQRPERTENVSIPREELESFLKESHEYLEEAIYMDVLENIAPILEKVRDILNRFSRHFAEEPNFSDGTQLGELKNTQREVMEEMQKIQEEEKKIVELVEKLKEEISHEIEAEREMEREKFTLRVQNQELNSSLNLILMKEENLSREAEALENEIKEGGALIGPEILSYKNFEAEGDFNRNSQEELRRKIERIKIKLEDAGAGGGADVLKEFEEVVERDKFLEKEMGDLVQSIESLQKLIAELREKINNEFQEGVTKINKEFHEFFSLMFGGGTGSLAIISEQKKKKDEEEDGIEYEEGSKPEQGIEINVSLPQKKVKELHALSGGERSLTSIALLFAMSQVNPPPFLVLDETDAALDESNSRKYGDMLEKLSKRSQLIVVTHNRETMSRAGVLYGVTIGADGASKLLSVKFEEATAIAN
ncbi:AAA family ATPase [Patescibacteria group bacterium]|nr:AAA family ATPase [Patescibacteria group bacterium]MBU1728083.1 AAA family ATPase [Patescibacteria group bacterium]